MRSRYFVVPSLLIMLSLLVLGADGLQTLNLNMSGKRIFDLGAAADNDAVRRVDARNATNLSTGTVADVLVISGGAGGGTGRRGASASNRCGGGGGGGCGGGMANGTAAGAGGTGGRGYVLVLTY